ncbi:MAG TPA: response regulator transcription factor [Acidimicrobiales bacterium]|nr:response regulator transcription factor [Acidimicrobiales bacterium]
MEHTDNTHHTPLRTTGDADPPEMRQIRLAVIDDHAMFAESLAALLDRQADLVVAGTATRCASGLALLAEEHPDVVLVDDRLPDGDGATLAAEILRRWPATHVVMLAGSADDGLLARVIEAGCSGLLPKQRSAEEVVAAVRAADRGESLVPTSTLAALLDRMRRSSAPSPEALSRRELEVLELLARGASTAHIAAELYLSGHTVRNHVRNILSKLGAHSKLEAVTLATRRGIVDLSGPDAYGRRTGAA